MCGISLVLVVAFVLGCLYCFLTPKGITYFVCNGRVVHNWLVKIDSDVGGLAFGRSSRLVISRPLDASVQAAALPSHPLNIVDPSIGTTGQVHGVLVLCHALRPPPDGTARRLLPLSFACRASQILCMVRPLLWFMPDGPARAVPPSLTRRVLPCLRSQSCGSHARTGRGAVFARCAATASVRASPQLCKSSASELVQ